MNNALVLVGVLFDEFFNLDSLCFKVGEFAAEILRHLVELLGGEAVLTGDFVVADYEIALLLDDVEFGVEDSNGILDYFLAAVGGVTEFFLLRVFLGVEAMIYRYNRNILIVNADADRLFVEFARKVGQEIGGSAIFDGDFCAAVYDCAAHIHRYAVDVGLHVVLGDDVESRQHHCHYNQKDLFHNQTGLVLTPQR